MYPLIALERESSTIVATAHDPVSLVMRVEFKRGVYDYQNVSTEIHQKVRDEGGSFFDKEIKKNPVRYPYSKVS